MNILIVDDLIAPHIRMEVQLALKRFKFVVGQPQIFICEDPEEADRIYAENDIDLALVDIDLRNTRNGFQLNIYQEKKNTTIQKNVLLFVSSKITGNEDRERLINGITLADFLDIEKRAPHFINAFNELVNIGKIVQLKYQFNKTGYIKVSFIFLIARKGDDFWLYFSDSRKRIPIFDTNIEELYLTFKKSHSNTLIRINPTTIVNIKFWKPGNPIPDDIIKDKINMNVSGPNTNLL